eukprot:scaffold49071_cov59-Phaeocystis_antarctica.AAC.4
MSMYCYGSTRLPLLPLAQPHLGAIGGVELYEIVSRQQSAVSSKHAVSSQQSAVSRKPVVILVGHLGDLGLHPGHLAHQLSPHVLDLQLRLHALLQHLGEGGGALLGCLRSLRLAHAL